MSSTKVIQMTNVEQSSVIVLLFRYSDAAAVAATTSLLQQSFFCFRGKNREIVFYCGFQYNFLFYYYQVGNEIYSVCCLQKTI